jgi:hypothetical protein
MVTMLEECITEEQRSVVLLNAKDIHEELFPVYVGKCLSRQAVPPWWRTFR